MAVTYVSTPYENGCRWSIGSLGGVWDDSNYMMCLISTYGGWPSGSSGQPPGSLDYQWPPTNGSNYNTPSQDFYEGLEAGRSYTLYGYAQAANGLWYPCGSASITTLAPTLSTPSPAEVNTYYNSITLQLYEVSGASTYYLDVYNSSNTCIRNLTSSNGYFNVTNLENSSQYAFYFKCSGSGYTDSGYGSYYPVNTQDGIELATPTLSLSSRTGTSIFLDVSYVGNAFRYDIEVYSSSYNYLATYSPIPPASGVLTTELYGLTPGTAYYFKVRARADTLTPYKSSPNSGYYGAWSTLVKLTTPTVRAQSQTATTITIQLNIDSRAQTCYCNLHRLSDDA
ncbi:MAG: hypothetical protein PHF24_05125, partial [Syntrophomonas sp.]|nr:hypothetical protein [Syntrophomonas sp.]